MNYQLADHIFTSCIIGIGITLIMIRIIKNYRLVVNVKLIVQVKTV